MYTSGATVRHEDRVVVSMRSRRQVNHFIHGVTAAAVMVVSGCTRITHTPQCPEQAAVGEVVDITATVKNPGAVPRYSWEVIPSSSGTLGNADRLTTTFTPTVAGEVTLRLSAADGLFLYVDSCVINVFDANVEVSLLVNPEQAVIGNSVLLTCTSIGDDPASSFTITQTAGETVELIPILPGVVAFDAVTVGTFTFECVGESPGGIASDPVSGTVTVSQGGRTPGR